MAEIVLYRAKRILTMDPNCPEATHVAVRDGRILAVGGPDCAARWGAVRADDSLAHAVLLPGFVEGHSHLMAGAMWRYPYAGYHDRIDPEGKLWKGQTTIEEVIEGLKRAEAAMEDPEAPLFVWGFDPIFLGGERLNRHHLDAVTTRRPVVVQHSNFHLLTANSAALALAQYSRETNVDGVAKDASGEPNGELQEMAAMFPLLRRLKIDFRATSTHPDTLRNFGATARLAGVTTATDLLAELPDVDVAAQTAATARPDYPVRIVPMLSALSRGPGDIAARALELRAKSTDKLRLGGVKLVLDGSIQGYTARLRWPGHVNGAPNGIWVIAPDQAHAYIDALHGAGVQMHIHTNGDEASAVALDALEAAITRHPWPNHRHTLQHGQMIDRAMFRRMKTLGLCANLFSNHIYYFGDVHAALTIGEDRARRMDACRTALDEGVPLAIHSDAPVTPMGPLFTAWCAVNRLTFSGRVLGAAQRITVAEALHAITLGAAYTLHLDGEIGSIEAGKRADFAVLGADPTAVDPASLKDVPVLGTVLGGRPFL